MPTAHLCELICRGAMGTRVPIDAMVSSEKAQ